MSSHRLTKVQLEAIQSADLYGVLYARADVGRRLVKAGLVTERLFGYRGYQLTDAGSAIRHLQGVSK